MANEEAIELASQLLGNDIIRINNKTFTYGSGITKPNIGEDQKSATWKINKGTLEVLSCNNPNLSDAKFVSIYKDNNQPAYDNCSSSNILNTRIMVSEEIEGSRVKNSRMRDRYALVNTKTSLKTS